MSITNSQPAFAALYSDYTSTNGCIACNNSKPGKLFGCTQSFFIDLKSLGNVSGLNSGIYSALTASFVLAGLSYIGLPSQTLTAIFGSAAEKGLEDIFLWQLIGTAVSMAVAPIAFTQQVRWSSKCICKAPATCEYCNKMQAM